MWKYKPFTKKPRQDWQVQALESRFMAACDIAPIPTVEPTSSDVPQHVETDAARPHEVIFVDERAMNSSALQKALVRTADIVVVSPIAMAFLR